MPRPIVLSNGRLWVGLDHRYAVRDFFFPHIGIWNHLSGHFMRQGLWLDDRLEWFDSPGWYHRLDDLHPRFGARSLIGSEAMGIEILAEERIDPDSAIWLRKFTLRDLTGRTRKGKLFSTHDFRLCESDLGDTALFHPEPPAIYHYKGEVAIGIAGAGPQGGIEEYACGVKAFMGLEGTWRDAEDGQLSMKSIEQGSVDSTFGLSFILPAFGEADLRMEVVASHSLHTAIDLMTKAKTIAWPGWRGCSDAGTEDRLTRGAEFAREMVLAHQTVEGGFVAATDSDILETARAHYAYIWMRDGALIGETLADSDPEAVHRFLDFGFKCLGDSDRFAQKYDALGRLGASWHPYIQEGRRVQPWQEDETALFVSLARRMNRDDEQVNRLVETLVREVGPEGLPNPSHDLWEERYGIHFWTVSCVIDALESELYWRRMYGSPEGAMAYEDIDRALARMRKGFQTVFCDPEAGLPRMMTRTEDGQWHPDHTPDAAILGGLLRPHLKADRELLLRALAHVESHLLVNLGVGGVARYAGDYYFRQTDDAPGNPWIICTMWLAQAQIALAESLEELEVPTKWLNWALDRGLSTGVMAEQFHPFTGEGRSVAPLAWSHAEFLETHRRLILRRRELMA